MLTALEAKVDEVDERHAPAVEAARQVIEDWTDEHNTAVENTEAQQQTLDALVVEREMIRGPNFQGLVDDYGRRVRQERKASSDYMTLGASGTDLMELTREATRADINRGIAAINEANRKETQPKPLPREEPEVVTGHLV